MRPSEEPRLPPTWCGVRLFGPLACFTRPEYKAERVSYEVPTPTALVGIAKAIYKKPTFEWKVRRIDVVNPVRTFSRVTNELSTGGSVEMAVLDAQKFRTQRHTLGLKDVEYQVWYEPILNHPAPYPVDEQELVKARDIFSKRVRSGAYFWIPCFGLSEYRAYFAPINHTMPRQHDLNRAFGPMVHSIDYQGTGLPRFFHCRIQDGTIYVPDQPDAGRLV